MPYFTPEVEVDIDIDDFYYAMTSKEKQKMCELLKDDDGIPELLDEMPNSVPEYEFNNIMSNISSNRLLLTSEEDELLKKIASRF